VYETPYNKPQGGGTTRKGGVGRKTVRSYRRPLRERLQREMRKKGALSLLGRRNFNEKSLAGGHTPSWVEGQTRGTPKKRREMTARGGDRNAHETTPWHQGKEAENLRKKKTTRGEEITEEEKETCGRGGVFKKGKAGKKFGREKYTPPTPESRKGTKGDEDEREIVLS